MKDNEIPIIQTGAQTTFSQLSMHVLQAEMTLHACLIMPWYKPTRLHGGGGGAWLIISPRPRPPLERFSADGPTRSKVSTQSSEGHMSWSWHEKMPVVRNPINARIQIPSIAVNNMPTRAGPRLDFSRSGRCAASIAFRTNSAFATSPTAVDEMQIHACIDPQQEQ